MLIQLISYTLPALAPKPLVQVFHSRGWVRRWTDARADGRAAGAPREGGAAAAAVRIGIEKRARVEWRSRVRR